MSSTDWMADLPDDGQARVGVVFGSRSDWPTMRTAVEVLERFDVPVEAAVVSAHRTPERLRAYATRARERGLQLLIAGAGGAAHLPGMLASWTTLPVLGVPIQSRMLHGVDSLLSIVQMPFGVPVGTLAIGEAGARNAALLGLRMLAVNDDGLQQRLAEFHAEQGRAAIEGELER